MKLRVHCYGGLAGQLAGLAYAMWVENELARRPVLVFHDGGVSRRPLEISDLVKGYETHVLHENAALGNENFEGGCEAEETHGETSSQQSGSRPWARCWNHS